MDPFIDELLEADALAGEIAESLDRFTWLLLHAGSRLRARGVPAGLEDFCPMHTTSDRLRCLFAQLRERLAPHAAQARRETCEEALA